MSDERGAHLHLQGGKAGGAVIPAETCPPVVRLVHDTKTWVVSNTQDGIPYYRFAVETSGGSRTAHYADEPPQEIRHEAVENNEETSDGSSNG